MRETLKIKRGIWYALLLSMGSIFFVFRGLRGVTFNLIMVKINWLYIAVGFLALIVVWCSKAYRMYVITKGMGSRVGFFQQLQIYLATCFISHVTPFSSGGTPLQIYLIYKQGLSLGKATAITTVDLGLNTFMFFILAPVSILTNLRVYKVVNDFSISIIKVNWTLVVFSFCLLAAVIWKRSYLWKSIKKIRFIERTRIYLKERGWFKRIYEEWFLFKDAWLLLIKENPVSIMFAILASLIYWLIYLLLAPIILWALGRQVSYISLLGWQLIFNFAQIMIPTPGGSGGSELILYYLFRNLAGETAIGIFVLFWKIYTFFSTLIVGGIFFWRLTRME